MSWDQRIETHDCVEQKMEWPAGPWLEEPDKIQWIDEATGLDCLIVRQSESGHLCGYAGVPPGHPLHGAPHSEPAAALREAWVRRQEQSIGDASPLVLLFAARGDDEDPRPDCVFDVHGSLTFSGGCEEGGRICHVPQDDRSKDVWWYGFDCMHCRDFSPRDMARRKRGEWMIDQQATYKDIGYVRQQTEKLAAQLKEIG
jgi:hypothetical protein